MQLPKPGDRVALTDYPNTFVIVACFDKQCGILSGLWPVGASQSIEIHKIASINGRPVSFAPPSEPQKKRRRKAA
jgi:hypothetical protein